MVYTGIGDGSAMGNGQSEPWDEKERWSHVRANRKMLFLGQPKGRLGWDRREKMEN
jgi:hypothetical protein